MAIDDSPPTLPPVPPQHSRIEPQQTVRKMRELLIWESELDQVGLLNTLAAGFFSAASACGFFVVGIIIDARMQDNLSEQAEGLLWFAIPAGLLLTLGFAIAGYCAWKAKGSTVAGMKRNALDVQPSVPPTPSMQTIEQSIPGKEESQTPPAS